MHALGLRGFKPVNTQHLILTSFLLGFGFILAGCSLADESLLDQFRDGGATGSDGGTDAGPNPGAVDQCGASDVRILTNSEEDIAIDTRPLFNRVSGFASCGEQTPGRDGFLGVQVQAGEYWHFHLRVNTAEDPDPSNRNPILYLLDDSCNVTVCNNDVLANFCSEEQDEHFGIRFRNSGLFYIGIDDGNAGGGAYLLDALRPVCDSTQREHGEACDGEANCSNDCLSILDENNRAEQGFNFNFFEANLISLGSSGTGSIEIQGSIGGFQGCAYPDVYAIDVPAARALHVETERAASTDCVPASELDIALQSATGAPAGTRSTTGDNCFVIDQPAAGGGSRRYIVMQDNRGSTNLALPYTLKVEVN